MNNFSFELKYSYEGQDIVGTKLEADDYSITYSVSDDALKLSLKTKRPLLLKSLAITYPMAHEAGEIFFGSGYQTWTTSREYSKNDRQHGTIGLANIATKLKEMAGCSGDYGFARYSKENGFFHGITYCYFRNGDDFDNISLYGSLNEHQGFTVFYRDMTNGTFCIEKDLEGLTLDGEYEVFDVVKLVAPYAQVFDKYFGLLGIAKPKLDSLKGYTSWYNYFQKIDEDIILRDLKGLTKATNKASIFQIDDGYAPYVGDWLDYCQKFPSGMKPIAEKIQAKGLKAGIWLAPLNVQRKSKTAEAHPDWLIRHPKTDKPIVGVVAWGGAYSLDIYNEEVRAHLKNVFNTVLNDWGFDMVKLDFLYSQCIYPRNNKTRGRIMRDAVEFLRECVGDKIFLGCGVPLGSALGLVDACRSGCDVDLTFKAKIYGKFGGVNAEIISTRNSIVNTVFRRHLKGALLPDPDVFFLRNNNLKFTEDQKYILMKVNSLLGSVIFVSDNAGDYNDYQKSLLEEAFSVGNVEVASAQFADPDTIEIKYLENDVPKVFKFSLDTGIILK